MDGLTNIIAKIGEQNEAECNEIIAAAENSAKAIIQEAKNQADLVVRAVNDETDKKVSVIDTKAVSSSELEYKRVILAKKSEILDACISSALEEISKLSDNEYFGYIEKLIVGGAVEGEGKVYFNAKDNARLPDGFVKNISEKLGNDKSLKLADECIDIMGGVVIEYPEMRIDCSFESLIADKKDDIRDQINKALFA